MVKLLSPIFTVEIILFERTKPKTIKAAEPILLFQKTPI